MHLKGSHGDLSAPTKIMRIGQKMVEICPFINQKMTKKGVTAAHFDFAVLSSGYKITCA